jgi:hypothetical protein
LVVIQTRAAERRHAEPSAERSWEPAGGEVVVLDSAGYGPLAITQAVSVIAPPGVYAGISVSSGDGIDINAASTDTVILRGLTINNQGSSGNGIVFNTGETLHIEGCVINGFSTFSTGNGILFQAGGKLEVKDSIFRGNFTGITVQPSSGSALATIDHVRLESNYDGLLAREGSAVTIRNSVASGNSNNVGLIAFSTTSATVEVNIENCLASNNRTGIIGGERLDGGRHGQGLELYDDGQPIRTVPNWPGRASVAGQQYC